MARISIISIRKSSPRNLATIGRNFKEALVQKFKEAIKDKKNFVITIFDNEDSTDPEKANKYSKSEWSDMLLLIILPFFRYIIMFNPEFEKSINDMSRFHNFVTAISLLAANRRFLLNWMVTLYERGCLLSFIFFSLPINISLGIISFMYFTYDIGIIIVLITWLLLYQLQWFSISGAISFYHMAHWAIFVGGQSVILELYFLLYQDSKIFYSFITHIEILYYVIWLVMHIKLFRDFGESHLFSSVILYSNIVNLFLKMLCLMPFYGLKIKGGSH